MPESNTFEPVDRASSSAAQTAVQVREVSRFYGDFTAVGDVSLDVREGEFLTLLGPSGSGKTTTLQMIAGFETPSKGEIHIHGKSTRGVPPHRRNLGMVFQSYSLVPHMTAYDNVAFPLKIRKMKKSRIDERVREVLEMVNLGQFAHRKPSELSGGQQQRVALARAFVYKPELLLMDEPLSALDKKLREHLQNELRNLHKTLGVTIVFVTHDQEEALRLSDRIAVFQTGKLVQCAPGEELYNNPANEFVASFLGSGNVFMGEVTGTDADALGVRLACGKDIVASKKELTENLGRGDQVKVLVRPEHMSVHTGGECRSRDAMNCLPAELVERIFGGGNVFIKAGVGEGETVEISTTSNAAPWGSAEFDIGRSVDIAWRPDQTMIFKASAVAG